VSQSVVQLNAVVILISMATKYTNDVPTEGITGSSQAKNESRDFRTLASLHRNVSLEMSALKQQVIHFVANQPYAGRDHGRHRAFYMAWMYFQQLV
jgi:hypothetical protein